MPPGSGYQAKEKTKTKQAPTAGPHEADRLGAGPADVNIEGRIVDFRDHNGQVRIRISGGASKGMRVGMQGYIKSGTGRLAEFEIDEVNGSAAFALLKINRAELGDRRFVVINPTNAAAPAATGPLRARVIGRSVEGNYVKVTIAKGSVLGVVRGMRGHLVSPNGTEGLSLEISEVDARTSVAYIEHTTVSDVDRQPEVVLYPKPSPKAGSVQRRAAGGTTATGVDAQATAKAGVAGAGDRLPHFDIIQRAFGKHDISNVQSQVGGAAADAADALDAHAYATGNKVAFGSAPDLHTAAHEAAHTIQQQHGVVPTGLGAADDEHERHADVVADAVVAGRSAEPLLDQLVTGAASTSALQLKPGPRDKLKYDPSWQAMAWGSIYEAAAPRKLTIPDAIVKGLDEAQRRSQRDGNEHGGNIVRTYGNDYRVRHGGQDATSDEWSQDETDVGRTQDLVGSFHSHPYDKNKENERNIKHGTFSHQDLANIADTGQTIKLVRSGALTYMITRTKEFDAILKQETSDRDSREEVAKHEAFKAEIMRTYLAAENAARAAGLEHSASWEAGVAAVCNRYHLVYYRGQGARLDHVATKPQKG